MHAFKPNYVFLEALWCPPTKFKELEKLHPKVKFIIRIHSEIPFLANEGVAIQWIKEYLAYKNVYISFNSKQTNSEFSKLLGNKKIIYLPNYYSLDNKKKKYHTPFGQLHVGCFGAIRPMKNQLLQAVCAMQFANEIGKTLHFHINSSRVEQRGDSVLKNLQNLFNNTPHKLMEHPWISHEKFLVLVKRMDLGMQVSMSETFNIVSADLVNNEIPVVASKEVEWIFPLFKASDTESDQILSKLYWAYYGGKIGLHNLNKIGLSLSAFKSKHIWLDYLGKKDLIGQLKCWFSKIF